MSRASLRWALPGAGILVLLAGGGFAAVEADTVSSYWERVWWALSLMTTVGFSAPGGSMPDPMIASLVADLADLGVSPWEKVLRSLLVFAFLVVALRLGGKRELAQINVMDLAVLLLASNALQNAMIGNDNSLLGGVLGASVLFAANYVFVRVTYRSERIRRVLKGSPACSCGTAGRRAGAAPRGDLGQRVTFGRSRARLCGSRRGGVDGARDRRAPGGDGAGGRQALARRVAVGPAEIAASCNVHAGLQCQA